VELATGFQASDFMVLEHIEPRFLAESLYIDAPFGPLSDAFRTALSTEKSVILTGEEDEAELKLILYPREIQLKEPAVLPPGFSLHGYHDKDGKCTAALLLQEAGPATTAELFRPLSEPMQKFVSRLAREHHLVGPWHLEQAAKGNVTKLITAPRPDLMPLFAGLGLNWAAYMAYEAMSRPVSFLAPRFNGQINAQSGELMINTDAIYLDMDDTLIIHRRLYDGALKLLKEAECARVPVHLITRHYRNPRITLAEYGLGEADFASIIWIEDETPKSRFIEGDAPIFIDDAFRERKEVANSIGATALPAEAAGLIKLAF
jgi:hypothetical protein